MNKDKKKSIREPRRETVVCSNCHSKFYYLEIIPEREKEIRQGEIESIKEWEKEKMDKYDEQYDDIETATLPNQPIQNVENRIFETFGIEIGIWPETIAKLTKKDFKKIDGEFCLRIKDGTISLKNFYNEMEEFSKSDYFELLREEDLLFPDFLEKWGFKK